MSAALFYQAATFAQHPASSLAWILGLLTLFAGVVGGLWYTGRHKEQLHVMMPEKA
jgi:ferrous iron transport protein B